MHPSYEMDREYAVRVRGEVDDEMIERLKTGVMLEDGPARFTDIQEAPGGEGFNHWYHCVVMEGRNREVRRLWESQGLVVSRLKRVRFGPVFMTSDLPMGRWREMSQSEVDILSQEVGLKPVALPSMKAKAKEKIDRMQRKVAKPLGRGERRPRVLRSSNEADVAGSDKPRAQRDDQGGRKPRVSEGRSDKTRGTPVAERPGDARKGGKRNDGAGRPSGPGKRPAGDGQRPGFGRSKRT